MPSAGVAELEALGDKSQSQFKMLAAIELIWKPTKHHWINVMYKEFMCACWSTGTGTIAGHYVVVVGHTETLKAQNRLCYNFRKEYNTNKA